MIGANGSVPACKTDAGEEEEIKLNSSEDIFSLLSNGIKYYYYYYAHTHYHYTLDLQNYTLEEARWNVWEEEYIPRWMKKKPLENSFSTKVSYDVNAVSGLVLVLVSRFKYS